MIYNILYSVQCAIYTVIQYTLYTIQYLMMKKEYPPPTFKRQFWKCIVFSINYNCNYIRYTLYNVQCANNQMHTPLIQNL